MRKENYLPNLPGFTIRSLAFWALSKLIIYVCMYINTSIKFSQEMKKLKLALFLYLKDHVSSRLRVGSLLLCPCVRCAAGPACARFVVVSCAGLTTRMATCCLLQ